jgi:hypothetical protein
MPHPARPTVSTLTVTPFDTLRYRARRPRSLATSPTGRSSPSCPFLTSHPTLASSRAAGRPKTGSTLARKQPLRAGRPPINHTHEPASLLLSLSLSLSPALSRTLPFHVLNDPVPALFDAPLTFARDALPSTRLALLARPTLCSIRRDDPRRTHLPPSAASCLSLLFPPPSCDAHALRSHLVDIAGGSSQQPRLGGQIKVPCCRRLG